MGRYPELATALPTNFVKPTRTAKLLTPAIVFSVVVVLTGASVVGIVVAGVVFGTGGVQTGGVKATQGLLLVASLLTILYVGFHFVAAVDNEPVGVIRPPVLRIHATCFVVARLALLAWVIAMIASTVVISKSSICRKETRDCTLQILAVVASTLAFVANGILLTSLESCHYPFQIPEALNARMITCRVSAFGDMDVLDRSVSQISFYEERTLQVTERPKIVYHKNSTERKTVLERENPLHIPGEWPQDQERPITPLLPAVHRSRSKGWGEEWTWTPAEDDGSPKKKALNHSDSAISMARSESSSGCARSSSGSGYAKSSTGYARSSSGYASTSDPESRPRSKVQKRQRRHRTVTPSSSISNMSQRSPLSTVRLPEYPKLAVQLDLRYTPPPLPQESRLSRTASMSQLFPAGDIFATQRRTYSPPPSKFQKTLPAIPGSPAFRKRSIKLRIPGSYVDSYHEQVLDDHIRKIEIEGVHRRQSQFDRQSSGSIGSSAPRRYHASSIASENGRRRESRRQEARNTIRRSQSSAVVVSSTQTREKIAKVPYVKGIPLRRLSLGDISSEFGDMWEV